MRIMWLTRTSVIAILVVAILGFLLLLVLRQQPSRSNDHQEPVSSSAGLSSKPELAGPPEPIRPTRPKSFRERDIGSLPFRVLDLVTGRPVAGASVCSNATGIDVCSEHPTDANGRGAALLPDDCVPPCEVYVALPQALGGMVVRAAFPKPPLTDILVPLFARLVVQTTLPHIPSGEDVDALQVGSLWCVSWPAPQDAFKKELPKTALSELQSIYSTMPTIESHNQTTEGAVRYHESIRRIPGFDASKLICLREEVKPGSDHTFDLAFAGDVLVSYYLAECDWDSKVRVQAVPGEIRRITLDEVYGKRLRLLVEDEEGKGVTGARVVIVTRWDLGRDSPQPDTPSSCLRPKDRTGVLQSVADTWSPTKTVRWACGCLGKGPGRSMPLRRSQVTSERGVTSGQEWGFQVKAHSRSSSSRPSRSGRCLRVRASPWQIARALR